MAQPDRFEERQDHLRAVAYRMLGSLSEADDAVQDAWLRLSRSRAEDVENLGGWLTTVVARVCLNMLRSRRVRGEESLDVHVPDPVLRSAGQLSPEEEALLADSVGLALLVVLDTLDPAERLAFVLHDMFALPFDEIAPMIGRNPAAARQLASRARRRVKGAEMQDARAQISLANEKWSTPSSPPARGAILTPWWPLLDPDVVLRIDAGSRRSALSTVSRGVDAVATQSRKGLRSWLSRPTVDLRAALVNGAAGVIVIDRGQPVTVMGFTIADGKIVEIDAIADPERVPVIAAEVLSGG